MEALGVGSMDAAVLADEGVIASLINLKVVDTSKSI
eukprot:CAMPEP_0197646860 /NCGR_PEP_ID=MMETSP1338-20131121/23900_1 /TAXON_ID=43686 ORGANISM="Pelagodinium beii, Strain RCC1491" /NCGR_SAMPLE_ID=MMETSP1338 /ASSEMBLY_ACC=CAM_ASM_000754 /LENGTH=35 /DNA_ID= /DNA_START= /DNA_END= /DNA_ORIENTATION=